MRNIKPQRFGVKLKPFGTQCSAGLLEAARQRQASRWRQYLPHQHKQVVGSEVNGTKADNNSDLPPSPALTLVSVGVL